MLLYSKLTKGYGINDGSKRQSSKDSSQSRGCIDDKIMSTSSFNMIVVCCCGTWEGILESYYDIIRDASLVLTFVPTCAPLSGFLQSRNQRRRIDELASSMLLIWSAVPQCAKIPSISRPKEDTPAFSPLPFFNMEKRLRRSEAQHLDGEKDMHASTSC